MRRAMTTTSVLGFSSPSFSYNTDIMLPVGVNQQLRDVLLSELEAAGLHGRASMKDRDVLVVRTLQKFEGVFVPEVISKTRKNAGTFTETPRTTLLLDTNTKVFHRLKRFFS